MPTEQKAPGGRTAVPFRRGDRISLERRSDCPDPSDLESVRAWVESQASPTAIDLFAGAGGLSLGLKRAGFSVLLGADSDPAAIETHAYNVGGLGWVGNLADPDGLLESLAAWGIDSVDLVAGGVPCQPFSRAGASRLKDLVSLGLRSQVDPRAGLWRSFLTVVSALSPRAVLVENVPDLPRWNDGAVLVGLLDGLRELGYSVDARVLSAYEYGVPQHRARLILVGVKDAGAFEWPLPRDDRLTLRDAIGDLPPVPGGYWTQRTRYLAGRTRSPYQQLMRKGLRGSKRWFIEDHVTRAVRPDDLQAYELLEEGQTYADLPPHLQRYRTDIFTDKYKRLAWDERSRSITAHIAKDGYWYIHPSQHRTLSIREAARVQSFPDDFLFAGQPTHRFMQIGNAVPPLLAEAIGSALKDALAAPAVPSRDDADAPRAQLLRWADDRRSHPWRRPSATPWQVLLGEIALPRVASREAPAAFRALNKVARSPRSAVSRRSDVRACLARIGSPGAAVRLLGVADALLDLFDGKIPDDHLLLRSLPDVGDHVAQMVLCFGYGRRAALLDQRTARTVARIAGNEGQSRWQTRLDVHRIAGDGGADAAFNASLMDLASSVCLPSDPLCGECPLQSACALGSTQSTVQTPLELAA